LFDEISLGLAPIVIKQVYEVIPSLVQDGLAAMVVEQDINTALSVSNRVYCLSEGRVALEGQTSSMTRDAISQAYFGV